MSMNPHEHRVVIAALHTWHSLRRDEGGLHDADDTNQLIDAIERLDSACIAYLEDVRDRVESVTADELLSGVDCPARSLRTLLD
jgi:hypothetical protein